MSEKKKMAIIVHSGTLDKLYPVFMLASAGGAMDVEPTCSSHSGASTPSRRGAWIAPSSQASCGWAPG